MDKIINAQAFEAYLVKTLKITSEELASLYNEAGELTDFSLIEQKDTARISKLTTDKTNQYNRGLKEGAEKLEKAVKDKYDVESDLIGVELFDHVVETKVAEVKGAAPEDILKNPEVIKLQNQHSKALKDKDKEWQQKLTDKEKEINKASLFNKVKTRALVEFEKLNPILPENAEKAQALKDVFLEKIAKFNYQEEGEDFVVLKEDGTPLQDSHSYNVTFADHIKGHADKLFDFKKAEDRSSSGLTEEQKKTQLGPKVRKPKDKDDYVKMMGDNSLTSKERIEIKNLAVAAGLA
jgi:hypothetical protein